MRSFLSFQAALLTAGIFSASAAFSAQLSLSAQSAVPGASLLIPVSFASEDGAISGFQFDCEYDNNAIALVATLSDPARNSGKSLYTADLTPNKRRFVVIGFNQNAIADGIVIKVLVNLNQNAAGAYNLKLSNLVATDPAGQSVPI